MDTPDVTFAPGAVIAGKYRLDRELGRGGMGTVYAATNVVLMAPVAIKVLHGEGAATSKLAARFLQEARAAAAVRHANIVGVLDFGQDDASGALYLVQEYLHGRDLKRYVQAEGPLAPREAVERLMPVMRALAYAHARGVVHRDLKPENIFLHETPEGVVPKVIDFGIAKVTDEDGRSAQHTRPAQVLGTPHYMSPEQARGRRAVDQRSDVWSLGVVLYYALTKRLPYEGETATIVMASIITHPPAPVTTWAPELPAPVAALVDGALQTDPDRRYPSMEAFWEAARACLGALGVHVDPPPRASLPERASSPKAGPPDFPTVDPQVVDTDVDPAPPRARSLIVAAAVSLALVAAFAGYRSGRTAPRAAVTAVTAAASPVPPRPPAVLAPTAVAAPAHVAPPAAVTPPPPVAPTAVAARTPTRHSNVVRHGRRTPPHASPAATAPVANVAY
ncbi:MAG: serine/threonine-protein kinase [Polyangiales bacterium]